MEYIKGCDVSRHNNKEIHDAKGNVIGFTPIDWSKALAQGVVWAGVRFTVGDYYIDPTGVLNYTGAKLAGIIPVPYAVSAPRPYTGSTKKITAQGHIDKLEEAIAMLPNKQHLGATVIDNELARGADTWEITALLEKIFGLVKKPINYTAAGFWNKYVLRSKNWQNIPLDVANYTSAKEPLLPVDYTNWYAWQWSADENTAGPDHGMGSRSLDLQRLKPDLFGGLAYLLPDGEPAPKPEPLPEPDTTPVWMKIRLMLDGQTYKLVEE